LDDGYENIQNGNLGDYHTYEEVVEELKILEEKHPNLVTVIDIGKSHQGRSIKAVQITNTKITDKKPAILYTGQTHAREVISAEVSLGLIKKLVNEYGKDNYITNLVDNREFWVVPVVNPDGSMIVTEQVTKSGDSRWRKNARDNNDDGQVDSYDGVDLNRNFSTAWGGPGSSGWPFWDTYRGPEPFSEPETIAIKNLVEDHDFVAAVSLHSFSGLILYPVGYTYGKTKDDKLFRKIAEAMREKQPHEKYTVMQSSDLYLASGLSDDWLYVEKGVLAFTFEIYKGDGIDALRQINNRRGDAYNIDEYNIFKKFNPPEKERPYHVENNIPPLLYLAEIADNPYKLE
jgi:carboxypeptidase T